MKPFEGTPNNAFGILSSVYRVLRKPILLESPTASKIVLATSYLYTYLRMTDTSSLFTLPGSFDSDENDIFIPDILSQKELQRAS